MADRLFSEINAKTLQRYEGILESVSVLAGTAARMPFMAATPAPDGLSYPGLPLMLEALDAYDFLFSTYAGYGDGSFIQLVAVRDSVRLYRLFGAPRETTLVLRTISADPAGRMQQHWRFLNRKFRIIGERDNLDPDYDPSVRPWYIRAQQEPAAFFTRPYIFSSTKLPGITCAQKLIGGDGGVFGADITLERFAKSLARQKVSGNGTLFLFDRMGQIIAYPSENSVRAGSGDETAASHRFNSQRPPRASRGGRLPGRSNRFAQPYPGDGDR
jgi:hypothetical protein